MSRSATHESEAAVSRPEIAAGRRSRRARVAAGRRATRPSGRGLALSAIDWLEDQHRQVAGLFAYLDAFAATDPRRTAVFARLAELLEAHIALEDHVFYPAARSELSDDLLDKCLEVHAILKRLLSQMRGLDATSPVFRAKLAVLRELVARHVKEEEFELFPESQRDSSDAQMQELGDRLAGAFRTRVGDPRRFEVADAELDALDDERDGWAIEFDPDLTP